jgi:hypothetical protein
MKPKSMSDEEYQFRCAVRDYINGIIDEPPPLSSLSDRDQMNLDLPKGWLEKLKDMRRVVCGD